MPAPTEECSARREPTLGFFLAVRVVVGGVVVQVLAAVCAEVSSVGRARRRARECPHRRTRFLGKGNPNLMSSIFFWLISSLRGPPGKFVGKFDTNSLALGSLIRVVPRVRGRRWVDRGGGQGCEQVVWKSRAADARRGVRLRGECVVLFSVRVLVGIGMSRLDLLCEKCCRRTVTAEGFREVRLRRDRACSSCFFRRIREQSRAIFSKTRISPKTRYMLDLQSTSSSTGRQCRFSVKVLVRAGGGVHDGVQNPVFNGQGTG